MNRFETLPSLYCNNTFINFIQTKKKTNIIQRINHQQRKWFQKRGKSDSVIFDDQMLKKLRRYFNDLDSDSSGAIGIDQLEDPLITLQFCQSKQDVKKLVDTIDLDGSGEIQFAQFLEIFRKIKLEKYKNPTETHKYQFFLKIFNEKMKNFKGKDMTFELAISQIRRKKILKQLTQNLPIKNKIKKQNKNKEIQFNFVKKIQNQFIQTPQISKMILKFKSLNYQRVQLGKNIKK